MCKYCDFQYTACHLLLLYCFEDMFMIIMLLYFVQNIMFQLDVRLIYVKTFLLTLYYVVILYDENHEIKGFFWGGGVICNSQNKIFSRQINLDKRRGMNYITLFLTLSFYLTVLLNI